jgi:hypothetical protein
MQSHQTVEAYPFPHEKSRPRIASSRILPRDRSLRHLEILPSDPAWGRAKGGRGWKVQGWRDD